MTRSLALALPLLTACATSGADNGDDTAADLSAPAVAAETWTLIAGYDSWGQLDSFSGLQPSDSPHGASVRVWYDATALDHIATGSGDMPPGATIVKEGYTDAEGTELRFVTVMRKIEDYGWFWASYQPDGTVALSGQPAACTDCHSAGQDYNLVATW